jgi:protein-tyrosine phosphatase
MYGMQNNRHITESKNLHRFFTEGATDLHCHCLPGLDDGPASMEDALKLCRGLVMEGISTVVATPHQLGRYEGRNSGSQIREAVDSLTAALEEHAIPLEVLPGAEVRIDERIPTMIRGGQVLTLADRVYLLLELPDISFIDPMPLVRWLAEDGITVVMAHVERYPEVQRRPDLVEAWIEAGAAMQINAGSLLGHIGAAAQSLSWTLIERQSRLLVATDAHDIRARPPLLSRAAKQIERRFGFEAAFRLCVENPRQVLGRSSRPPTPKLSLRSVAVSPPPPTFSTTQLRA